MFFFPICGLVQLPSVIVIKICRQGALCSQEQSSPPPCHPGEMWDLGWKEVTSSQKWPEILLRREGLQQRRQLLLISDSCPKRRHWEVNENYWVSKSRWNPEVWDSNLSVREFFRSKEPKALCPPASGPKLSSHQPTSLWKTCAVSHCNTSLPLELVSRQNQYCIEFLLTFGWNGHASGSSEKMAVISPFYRCPYLSLHSQAWPWKLDVITATIPSPGGNELKKGFISFFNSEQANNNKMHLGNIIERNSSLFMKTKMIVF